MLKMYEYSLNEVFEEINRRDFLEYDQTALHFFSLRHRRAIREILHPNTCFISLKKQSEQHYIPLRRRLILIVIIIFLATVTGAIIIFRVPGFSGTVYIDNTHMFALNDPNAPKTIEKIYVLEALPSNYECTDGYGNIGDSSICRIYTDAESGNIVSFHQYVKSEYNTHFDNEHSEFVAIEINGKDGFVWQSENSENKIRALVWDNGDYILDVGGEMNKNEIVILAKSAKIL